MTASITIFSTKATGHQISRLRNLVEHLGLAVIVIEIADESELAPATLTAIARNSTALVYDVDTLCKVVSLDDVDALANALTCHDVKALFLAASDTPPASRFLYHASGGVIDGIGSSQTATATTKIYFPEEGAAYSRQLSRQTYTRGSIAKLFLLSPAEADVQPIMMLDRTPSFVRLTKGASQVFVWATPQIFDIHRPLVTEREFEEPIDEYLPAIMFVRDVGGRRCWHNPDVKAGLVIDDPLLVPRYGFLNFEELLPSAREHRYHVTLAFIPWNHWRSRQRNVQLFETYADCFRVCVHGCDHNNNEFGISDYETLLAKNHLATERMNLHRDRTGMSYEPLFVCPQEQCSVEAWKAFADAGQFLAMVNTGCMPRNLPSASLSGADLLAPVQDSFFGFPVFKRHYWKNLPAFAMDLFLGKPAILVEHHEFFHDRCKRMEEFAHELREIDQRVQWAPLLETVTTSHWRRESSSHSSSIRFFTREFRFSHLGAKPYLYRLTKRIGTDASVGAVLVNEIDTPFSIEGDMIHFEIAANAPASFTVSIKPKNMRRSARKRFSMGYRAGVFGRRALSEFRDNVVARNATALKIGRALMSSFRLTGSSRSRRKASSASPRD